MDRSRAEKAPPRCHGAGKAFLNLPKELMISWVPVNRKPLFSVFIWSTQSKSLASQGYIVGPCLKSFSLAGVSKILMSTQGAKRKLL